MQEVSDKLKAKEELAISCAPSHHQSYPWLVHSDGDGKERQVFYSIVDDCYHVRFIPQLKNEFMTCSDNRWLVIQDDHTSECFLLNLASMDRVTLPPIDNLGDYAQCVLSSPMMDDTCRVVFFDNEYPGSFLSCYLGDAEFLKQEVTTAEELHAAFEVALNVDGSLYVLTLDFNLLNASFSDPHLCFRKIVESEDIFRQLSHDDEMKAHLVESCGDLLFIYTLFRDTELIDIRIFKADVTTKKWVNIDCLGDRAIFFDEYASFSSPASELGLKRNCVYYVKKYGNNLFIYDLEDQSISMSLTCSIVSPNSPLSWIYVLHS